MSKPPIKDQAEYQAEIEQMRDDLVSRGLPVPSPSLVPGLQAVDVILTHAGLSAALRAAQSPSPTSSASSASSVIAPGASRNWTELASRARRGEKFSFNEPTGLTAAALAAKRAQV